MVDKGKENRPSVVEKKEKSSSGGSNYFQFLATGAVLMGLLSGCKDGEALVIDTSSSENEGKALSSLSEQESMESTEEGVIHKGEIKQGEGVIGAIRREMIEHDEYPEAYVDYGVVVYRDGEAVLVADKEGLGFLDQVVPGGFSFHESDSFELGKSDWAKKRESDVSEGKGNALRVFAETERLGDGKEESKINLTGGSLGDNVVECEIGGKWEDKEGGGEEFDYSVEALVYMRRDKDQLVEAMDASKSFTGFQACFDAFRAAARE